MRFDLEEGKREIPKYPETPQWAKKLALGSFLTDFPHTRRIILQNPLSFRKGLTSERPIPEEKSLPK